MSKIKRLVAELLQKYSVQRPPVPVEDIVRGHGILIVQLPGSDDVSGALMKRGLTTVIAVNPTHHPNRQRFTLAHELADFCLHPELTEHADRDLKVAWRDSTSSKAVNWSEIEANRFAAELLMPDSFLKQDLDKLATIDADVVSRLALKYAVSRVAMEIRLTNLGIIPPELSFG